MTKAPCRSRYSGEAHCLTLRPLRRYSGSYIQGSYASTERCTERASMSFIRSSKPA